MLIWKTYIHNLQNIEIMTVQKNDGSLAYFDNITEEVDFDPQLNPYAEAEIFRHHGFHWNQLPEFGYELVSERITYG